VWTPNLPAAPTSAPAGRVFTGKPPGQGPGGCNRSILVHFYKNRPIAWCTCCDHFRIIFCSSGRIFSKKVIVKKKFCTRSRSHLKIFKRGTFANENAFAKKKYPARTWLTSVQAPVPVENFSRFTCDHNREIFFPNAITIAFVIFQMR